MNKAAQYYLHNYNSQFNCVEASNQKIKQFDFHDMVDFATQFAGSQNKELIEFMSDLDKTDNNETVKYNILKNYIDKLKTN